MDDAAPKPKKQPSKEGKSPVAVYLPKDAVYVLQELLLKLSRERSQRVTMTDAITESLVEFCQKHGTKLPI